MECGKFKLSYIKERSRDMALALKWVKSNIDSFGGDPNQITVCGQSAGAVSTDLLTLSPVTRDLFSRAIIFAGTSNGEWLYMDSDLSRTVMVEYAKHLGANITGTTKEEIDRQTLGFLTQLDASNLALGIRPNPDFKFYPKLTIPLGPCYDNEFFPKSLDELRKESPKKNVINGVTEYEGLLFSKLFVRKNKSYSVFSHGQETSAASNDLRGCSNLQLVWH